SAVRGRNRWTIPAPARRAASEEGSAALGGGAAWVTRVERAGPRVAPERAAGRRPRPFERQAELGDVVRPRRIARHAHHQPTAVSDERRGTLRSDARRPERAHHHPVSRRTQRGTGEL